MSLSGLNAVSEAISKKPKFGIIGGSGLCSFPELNEVCKIRIETKYGFPSDDISICEMDNVVVAFLPRHGSQHTIAPHKIPYKANLAALKILGVQCVVGTCIVGSLKKEIIPGSIVCPDQFVNLTWGRDDTHEADEKNFIHLPMGEPYCNHLREKVIESVINMSMPVFPQATVAVIQGPRFSTAAESRWFSKNGWDIVNMTQYPECYFARELGLCYCALATVTDYDVGLKENLTIDMKNMDIILKIFKSNIQKTKSILLAFMNNYAVDYVCGNCSSVFKTYYTELI